MVINPKSLILIAEDDEDDFMLTLEALREAGINSEIEWVKDGEELIQYLGKSGESPPYNQNTTPRPCLILMDLNMPKMDGREALQEIKRDQVLRKIPVVVLTTSKADIDIDHTYDLGVNSFIQKPLCFKDFVEMARVLSQYWFSVVQLPN